MTTQHDQDKAAFEEWAISHGGLFLHPAANEDISLPLWPRTYANYTTEIAWRAWANKPVSQQHAQALKDARYQALGEAATMCAVLAEEYSEASCMGQQMGADSCLSAIRYMQADKAKGE